MLAGWRQPGAGVVLGMLGEHPGWARALVVAAAVVATVLILLPPKRTAAWEVVPMTDARHSSKPVDDPFHGRAVLREVTIDVPTRYADDIAKACRVAGWLVRDSGLTVSTDDDEHALTTLLVDIPLGARAAEAAQAAVHGGTPVVADPRVPYLFHAIFSNRDLFLGDDVVVDHHVSAEGRVVVGAGARVKGRIRAGGDVVVKDGATVGHVVAEGAVRLEGSARVTDAVEARGGLIRDLTNVSGFRALRTPDEQRTS